MSGDTAREAVGDYRYGFHDPRMQPFVSTRDFQNRSSETFQN